MPGRILRLCKNFPASTSPLTQMARGIRCFVCYPIFDHCGKNVNIERGANFSMGGISIDSGSGLGINCAEH